MSVTEKFLDSADVITSFEKMGSEAMAHTLVLLANVLEPGRSGDVHNQRTPGS
jgi:hypothetical protein